MSLEKFKRSQFFKQRSKNLFRLGWKEGDVESQYHAIRKELLRLYAEEKKSSPEIMKHYRIPSLRTINIIFRLFDIPSRTLSESGKVALKNRRASLPKRRFKVIYHVSWDGVKHCCRSSYEVVLAKKLDSQKKKYLIESLRIPYWNSKKGIECIAIPDFYLPEENRIIEVKSSYWFDKEEMIDKKKAYTEKGYKFSLFLDQKFTDCF